jgi:hypothetical protein
MQRAQSAGGVSAAIAVPQKGREMAEGSVSRANGLTIGCSRPSIAQAPCCVLIVACRIVARCTLIVVTLHADCCTLHADCCNVAR